MRQGVNGAKKQHGIWKSEHVLDSLCGAFTRLGAGTSCWVGTVVLMPTLLALCVWLMLFLTGAIHSCVKRTCWQED